jgi:hypothetical protein
MEREKGKRVCFCFLAKALPFAQLAAFAAGLSI